MPSEELERALGGLEIPTDENLIVGIEIFVERIPILPEALEFVTMGLVPMGDL